MASAVARDLVVYLRRAGTDPAISPWLDGTPMDYLYRVRLALARELIRETRLDLEHVAERAGFGSAHHMRRVWRRHESGSPSAARHPA
ncbi:AraC family transcriptional regulator [Bordetella pertussis]|nr:AraC family transcriptional regulator [Bordetella pertussis]